MARSCSNSLQRKKPSRQYKKICLISCEGSITEKQYFNMPIFKKGNVTVSFVPRGRNAATNPKSVLGRMERELKKSPLRDGDTAWLIIDKDKWVDEEFEPLFRWVKSNPQQNKLCISNPKFELFLLMHFEPRTSAKTASQVDRDLKRHIPNYEKQIPENMFDESKIRDAIAGASSKRSTCSNREPAEGMTDAFKLASYLLESFKK